MNATQTTAQRISTDERLLDTLCDLFVRWEDEQGHEDIADYGHKMAPLLETHGAKLLRMTGRPFGFVFSADAKRWALTLSTKGILRIKAY